MTASFVLETYCPETTNGDAVDQDSTAESFTVTAKADATKKNCISRKTAELPTGVVPLGEIVRRQRLGGLLKHDRRLAA